MDILGPNHKVDRLVLYSVSCEQFVFIFHYVYTQANQKWGQQMEVSHKDDRDMASTKFTVPHKH